jgi:signal transduction histidine kinase
VHLPTRTESIQIDYTALSLAIPTRVRFRCKLDGVDRDWQESGSRRQAFYTNLGPGQYIFQVVACNSDGVWNDAGATVEFTIPPTFAQSAWFKALCVIGLASVLLLTYRLRMAHVTGQLRVRIHERAAERERIARDLHDTFFQSIQGLLLRFHTATSRLQPDDPARPVFEEALTQSDDVMAEGRKLLVHLHGAAPNATDLPGTLADAGEQMREGRSGGFNVAVNGDVRPLHPIVFEELSRIGNEALGNAFRHSGARAVETELDYGPHELRMRIRDDGRGIESSVLKKGGRDGHLGLASMRERSRNIGARLEIWSRTGVGTEIDVRLPADLAYSDQPGKRRRFWQHSG